MNGKEESQCEERKGGKGLEQKREWPEKRRRERGRRMREGKWKKLSRIVNIEFERKRRTYKEGGLEV
jgi:hypothetical protein